MGASRSGTGFIAAMFLAVIAIGIAIRFQFEMQAAAKEMAGLRKQFDDVQEKLRQSEKRAGRAEALAQAAQESAAAVREQVLLDRAAQAAAKVEPAAVAPGAAGLPDMEATKAVLAVAGTRADLGDENVQNVRAWAEQDPTGLLAWIATVPAGSQREHTQEAVIASVTGTIPGFAFQVANSIERDLPRTNRLMELFLTWSGRDPVAANQAIAGTDLPATIRERLKMIASPTGPQSP